MKIKFLCVLFALLFAVVGFSACGKTEAAPETTTEEVATDGDWQNPVMNFVGNYQSDRRTMLIEAQGQDEAKVTVSWGSDAWTHSEWVMTGKTVQEGDKLVLNYTDGTYATVTTDENGSETRSDETTGGTGTITIQLDGKIIWTDDQDEMIKDLVFVWLPVEPESDDQF